MSTKQKRRTLNEVLWENEYFLVMVYLASLFFGLVVLALGELRAKIFGRLR